MTRLGTLAPNGATYYANEDINEVRQFLRDAGLDIHNDKPIWKGWCSRDERLSGQISYSASLSQFVGCYRDR